MDNNIDRWFLDFSEAGQMWHIDLKRVPENASWRNIGYGHRVVLHHFCDVVDLMAKEFGMKFTTEQVVRLAECTPGLTVYEPTKVPDVESEYNMHMSPIWSKESVEKQIEWKPDEV